ncbi:MAG: ATP-binding protein [Candidatus Margulisiibacteriota bacterium]
MIQRHITTELKARFLASRSLYIFGPRQSGKTTLARETFPELRYISLEDPDHLAFATDDPRGFLNQFETQGIIDEPQRCPSLFSYLQSEIDIKKKKFILTSSQNFLLMEKVSQSLAGRISLLNLLPLSLSEIEHRPLIPFPDLLNQHTSASFDTLNNRLETIITGGYPELWENPAARSYWHSDYVRTYLERDVRQILQVQDLGRFNQFLKLTAGRSGSLLNKASLAADCGLSETHCARWLSILEQSGIIYLLKPFYQNYNKRLTKSPKLYFNDTGLLCHLLSISTPTHLETHPLFGNIVETFVVSELRKNHLNQGLDPDFYFWRDAKGEEIDLIVPHHTTLIPVEIKSTQTIKPETLKPLFKWMNLSGSQEAVLLYGGTDIQHRTQAVIFPISAL